jgi:hypothetical protein
MIRSILLAALFVGVNALIAGNALASHCPSDVEAINTALETADVSEEQREQITMLRDEGASLHEAGSHSESEAKLHEAMELLGIEH